LAIEGEEAAVVRYILSSVGSGVKLNRRCPRCLKANGNIHSGERCRCISDLKASFVSQRRMRCPWCGKTWTLRAEGVGPGRYRSDRLRGIGVILYMLGLSYRAVEQFLPCLECAGSKSSIERDVRDAGRQAREYHLCAPRMRVRVLGVDGTGAAMAGLDRGVLFFTDVKRNALLLVEPLQETDTEAVRAHVREVFAAMGAVELRTDEHSVYEGIVDEGAHRLCLAHWNKSKGKRCADLHRQAAAGKHVVAAGAMRKLLGILRQKPRPPTVPGALERLVTRYIGCRRGLLWKINQLLQHVERTWEKVSDDAEDATNNVTERIIGQTLKVRSKTMRGFKSHKKVLNHAYLSSFLQGEQRVADLRKVI